MPKSMPFLIPNLQPFQYALIKDLLIPKEIMTTAPNTLCISVNVMWDDTVHAKKNIFEKKNIASSLL